MAPVRTCRARRDRADQRDTGDHQEEAADIAPRVDDVAHQLADGAAVAGGEVGLVAAGETLAGFDAPAGHLGPAGAVRFLAGGRRRRGRTLAAALGLAALGRGPALAGSTRQRVGQVGRGVRAGGVGRLGAVAAAGQAELHEPEVYGCDAAGLGTRRRRRTVDGGREEPPLRRCWFPAGRAAAGTPDTWEEHTHVGAGHLDC